MPEEVVFLSFSSIVAVTMLGFGLMRTISKHLERKYTAGGGESKALRGEIDEMRAQLRGVDDLRERMADLEERTDFNERILAQRRDQQALPGSE